MDIFAQINNQSVIEQTYCSENFPQPLFVKEGEFLPFVKGGKEGFSLQGLHYSGLTGKIKNLFVKRRIS
jgi:hypothetical protein